MKRKLHKYRIMMFTLALALLLGASVSVSAKAEGQKAVRIGTIGYEGFIEADQNGGHKGYGVTYLNRISQLTGWKYEYIFGTWEENLAKLERGELDFVCTAQKTPEREKRFDFSRDSIGTEETIIYTRRGNQDIYYQDYDQMNGKTVAMFGSSFQNEEFARYEKEKGFSCERKMYQTDEDVMNAVLDGETDLAVLGSLSRHDELKVVDRFHPVPFYFMTTKGNSGLLDSLNTALDFIKSSSPYLEEELYQEYYGREAGGGEPLFTREEAEYIENTDTLTVICMDGFYPLSYKNGETGEPDGILAEIARRVAEKSGLKLKLVSMELPPDPVELLKSGRADLISGVIYSQTLIEDPDVQLTEVMLTQTVFLVAQPGYNIYEQQNPVIVLPASYQTVDSILPEELSTAQIVWRDSLKDCFTAVVNGEADATIQSIYVANYFMQMQRYRGLTLSAIQSASEENCIMASSGADRTLISVLNKSISCLDDNEINQVVGNYSIGKPYRETFLDLVYEYRFQIIMAAVLFASVSAFLFILNQRRIRMKYELREKEIYKRKAESDELTGLNNRKTFYRRAAKCLEGNPDGEYWILFFNIENFKIINDLFGIREGDKLLKFLASLIKEEGVKYNGVSGRFEADHFVILAEERDISVGYMVNEIRESLSKYPLDIAIELTCGMYEISDKKKSINIMCDRAHLAANSIKGNHLQRAAVYDDVHRQKMVYEQVILSEMEEALKNRQFQVYLQPKYNMTTGQVIGAEALVRWIHPTRGVIFPGDFIPIFEHNGFIAHLDLYMFEQTCMLLHKWAGEGRKLLPVSVNLSRVGFYNPKLCENLLRIVGEYQVPVSLLELEVTESAYVKDSKAILGILQNLRAEGFRVLMDDFGSGYSSLNMLKEAPIDEIKLDMRFLSASDPYNRAEKILRMVVAMGNAMSLSVLAEGVETEEQVNMLRSFSCNKAQGYYYSKPVTVEEYEKLLPREK